MLCLPPFARPRVAVYCTHHASVLAYLALQRRSRCAHTVANLQNANLSTFPSCTGSGLQTFSSVVYGLSQHKRVYELICSFACVEHSQSTLHRDPAAVVRSTQCNAIHADNSPGSKQHALQGCCRGARQHNNKHLPFWRSKRHTFSLLTCVCSRRLQTVATEVYQDISRRRSLIQ